MVRKAGDFDAEGGNMPALALYNNRPHRVIWLGRVTYGAFKGTKRAKLVPIEGGRPVWVGAADFEFVRAMPATKKGEREK